MYARMSDLFSRYAASLAPLLFIDVKADKKKMQALRAGREAVKIRVNKNDELSPSGSGPVNASPSSSPH